MSATDDLESPFTPQSLDEPAGEDDGGRQPDTAGEALTAQRRRALAEARRNSAPAPRESWRKRTATGAVLTGFALGFREALGLEPERAAIIMEAPGDPPSDLPVDAEVDQIRPADNVVRIRPWLLANGDSDSALLDDDEDSDGAPGALAAEDPDGAPGARAAEDPDGTPAALDSDGTPAALSEPADNQRPATVIPVRRPAVTRRRGRR